MAIITLDLTQPIYIYNKEIGGVGEVYPLPSSTPYVSAPGSVSLRYPLDKDKLVPGKFIFKWSPSRGASLYNLEYSTDSNFVNNVVNVNEIKLASINEVSHEITEDKKLEENTKYFYRVSAKNLVGSKLSAVNEFTTLKTVVLPPTNIPSGTLVTQIKKLQPISLDYVDISVAINENKPSVDVGKYYEELIKNKDEIITFNNDLFKKIEIIIINLIYKGNDDYNNLKSDGSLFSLQNGNPYIGLYHFHARTKLFMVGSEHISNRHEKLTFKFPFKLDYSELSNLDTLREKLNINNTQLNKNIGDITIKFSTFLNFLVGLEKSLTMFYGFDNENKKNSIRALLEENLKLTKYRKEVNWESLISQFSINGLSQSALVDIYFSLFSNYRNLLDIISLSIPLGKYRIKSDINFTLLKTLKELILQLSSTTLTPSERLDIGLKAEFIRRKFYTVGLSTDVNGDLIGAEWRTNYFGNDKKTYYFDDEFISEIPEYASFFDFGDILLNSKGITKFKNLLSILLGTVEFSNIDKNDENFNFVVTCDFIINKFLKIYKDLQNKLENPNNEIYPLEYLTSNENIELFKKVLDGIDVFKSKLYEITQQKSQAFSDAKVKEKSIFVTIDDTQDRNKVIIDGLLSAIKEIEKTLKNIYVVASSLAKVSDTNYTDQKIIKYINEINKYKWYNDNDITAINASNEINISDNMLMFFDIVKKLDIINWPASKSITTEPEYYIAPEILYMNSEQSSPHNGEHRYLTLGIKIYIPPYGWQITDTVFGHMPIENQSTNTRQLVSNDFTGDIYTGTFGGTSSEKPAVNPDIREVLVGETTLAGEQLKVLRSPYVNYVTAPWGYRDKGNDFRPIIRQASNGKYSVSDFIILTCRKTSANGSYKEFKFLTILVYDQWR